MRVVSRLVARAPRTSTTAVVLVAVLLTACSTFDGTGDLEYVQGDGKITIVAPEDRQEPVEVSGETIQGEALSYDDYRGRVMVINVWGSWCVPCEAEMPMLVQADEELDDAEVAFVGINIRDHSTDNAAAFERKTGVQYPSLYDPGSELLLEFGRYAPYAPPSTIILDPAGRVAALISGEVPSKTTLVELVEDVLAEENDG